MRFRITSILGLMIFGLLLIITPHATAQDDDEPLFLFRGARPLGLGNAYEAIADDINALHYNPAGLAQIDETIFQFLVVRARVTTDLVDELDTIGELFNDTINPLTKSDNPLTDPNLSKEREELVKRAEKILTERLGADIGLPSLGLIIPLKNDKYRVTLGATLYTQLLSNVKIVERGLPWRDKVIEMLDNHVVYRVTGQVALGTALAVQIPVDQPFLKSANVGVGLRWMRRGTFSDEDNPFEIVDILDPDEFEKNYFDLEPGESFSEFARDNLDFASGYSLDLGTLLTPVDGLRVGLVWRNIVNNIRVETTTPAGVKNEFDRDFPSNFVVSVAAKPLELLGETNGTFDLTVAASLDDPNGDDRLGEFELDSLADHIHLGIEAILWPKGLFSLGLRAGDNQGFATYGATLRLFKFLNLDVARYGDLETDWWVGSMEITF